MQAEHLSGHLTDWPWRDDDLEWAPELRLPADGACAPNPDVTAFLSGLLAKYVSYNKVPAALPCTFLSNQANKPHHCQSMYTHTGRCRD